MCHHNHTVRATQITCIEWIYNLKIGFQTAEKPVSYGLLWAQLVCLSIAASFHFHPF